METPQPQKTVAVRRPGALAVMAGRLDVEPVKLLDTLKATCFKGASAEELLALVVVANEYHLNPLLNEMYAFPAKGGGITPVVGIDGWTKIVNRQESYDGAEFEWHEDDAGHLQSCTCTMHIKGRSHPVIVREYLVECSRNTDPWNKMPRRMLRHKAFMQCARLAFGLSGIQDEDEARDVSGVTLAVSAPVMFARTTKPAPQIAAPPTVASPEDDVPMDTPAPAATESAPQAVLESALEGVPFDDFRDFTKTTLNLDLSDCGSWSDIPAATAASLLKDQPKQLAKCIRLFKPKA